MRPRPFSANVSSLETRTSRISPDTFPRRSSSSSHAHTVHADQAVDLQKLEQRSHVTISGGDSASHENNIIYDVVGKGEKSKKDDGLLNRSTGGVEGPLIFREDDSPSLPAKDGPVSWSDLPNKRQLAILTIARLSEPLTQTSLQAYMYYQLRSFDTTLLASSISVQAGMLQGSFAAAQFLTAFLWGRMADSDSMGRKRVLLVGLLGTCISCIGFGFSRSFVQAIVFRTIGGALNGNVGVMRTMISEMIREKKFQSRAFLLLPMCFNLGVIIGPILGGLRADPVGIYPSIFGSHSIFGGKDGIWWLKHWPYALPNLMSATFLLISAAGVVFGLEEVYAENAVYLCSIPT